VTRGNNAPGDKPAESRLAQDLQFQGRRAHTTRRDPPGNGSEFGPRHIDFHPTQPWVYVSIESQNKLYVYRREAATGLTRDPIFIKETLADPKAPARQAVGTVHVHPTAALSM